MIGKKHKSALAIFVQKGARLTTFIPVKRKDDQEVEKCLQRSLVK